MSTAFARRGYSGGAIVTELAVDTTNAATSMSAVLAATYPAANFHIVIDEGIAGFEECIFIGTRTGNNFTNCVRGENGTAGVAHIAGATIRHVLVAQDLDEANSVASVLNTKGDLPIKKAGGATTGWDRLPVGGNGQLLVGRSSASLGVAYEATPAELLAALQALYDARYAPISVANVGHAERTTAQTGISTITDLTGLSVTFTALAGRRYKITGICRVVQNTSNGANELSIRNAANTVLNRSTKALNTASNNVDTHVVFCTDVPGAGSVTYKLSLLATAGTTDTGVSATQPASILVEDVGT